MNPLRARFMKRITVVLCVAIALFTKDVSARFRMIDKDKSWNVLKSFYRTKRTVSYKFLEDTVIGDFHYTNLYYSFAPTIDTNFMFYAGAVREDTLAGKVFLRFVTGESFLIYDFKAAICDQIDITTFNARLLSSFEVEFADTVVIDSVKRRRMYLTSLDPSVSKDQVWIEGIGSNVGLIETAEAQYGSYSSSMLCCKNKTNLIWSSRKSLCFITTSDSRDKIVFKRNKRSSRARMISLDFDARKYTVKVISMKGKVVREKYIRTRKDLTFYKVRRGDYIVQIVDSFNKIHFAKKLTI